MHNESVSKIHPYLKFGSKIHSYKPRSLDILEASRSSMSWGQGGGGWWQTAHWSEGKRIKVVGYKPTGKRGACNPIPPSERLCMMTMEAKQKSRELSFSHSPSITLIRYNQGQQPTSESFFMPKSICNSA